jgi:hypothetical protein
LLCSRRRRRRRRSRYGVIQAMAMNEVDAKEVRRERSQ